MSHVWYTKHMEKLSKIIKNKTYIIKAIEHVDSSITAKLNQVGFIEGQKVICLRHAPIFKDPILIKVGDSQIALTKSEADHILVTEEV